MYGEEWVEPVGFMATFSFGGVPSVSPEEDEPMFVDEGGWVESGNG